MASDKDIKEFVRELWTADDLRDLVTAIDGWPGTAPVKLTAAQPQSRAGTIEVEN